MQEEKRSIYSLSVPFTVRNMATNKYFQHTSHFILMVMYKMHQPFLFLIPGLARRTCADSNDWPSMWLLSSQVLIDNSSSFSLFMIRGLARGNSNSAQKFDCVNTIGVRLGTAKTHSNHHIGISDGFKENQTEKVLLSLTCPCSDLKLYYGILRHHHRRLFTALCFLLLAFSPALAPFFPGSPVDFG